MSTPCSDLGCLDPLALNFDPYATVDDSSCVYPNYGCIDSLACNYDSLATVDDGSCLNIYGCTDSTAINYNSLATLDDGSCIQEVVCNPGQSLIDVAIGTSQATCLSFCIE